MGVSCAAVLVMIGSLVGISPLAAQNVPGRTLDYARTDSIVLTRVPGYFGGASYSLTIARDGAVRYTPGARASIRDSTVVVSPTDFGVLMAHAAGSAFVELPDTIMRHPTFCLRLASDHGTVVVSLFHPNETKRVVDYPGCAWAPTALREFESAIERVAGVDPRRRG